MRNWNKLLIKELTDAGYLQSHADPCLFFKKDKDNLILIGVCVDDCLIAYDNSLTENVLSLIARIGSKYSLKDLGEPQLFLGINITRTPDYIHLNQHQYAVEVLNRFHMDDCKPWNIPMSPRINFNSLLATTDSDREKMRSKNYRSLIGSLQYLACATRPDISFAVGVLSRVLHDPSILAWEAALDVLRYIKGTLHFGIRYKSSKQINLTCMSDANWAPEMKGRRSISGYVNILGKGAISWQSKLQPTVAHSSTEAEFIAIDAEIREVMWLKRLIQELGIQLGTVTIHSDNTGAITISKDPALHPRTKHIDVKYHYIRDKVEEKEATVTHCPTADMIADIFTKPLAHLPFSKFREQMGVMHINA
jgi:hypothetical protein